VPHRVVLIPGDGIGPEVVEAARRALEATGVRFAWDVRELGAAALERHGTTLPRAALESIAACRVALKGPVATPAQGGFRSVNLELRDELGLQAGIRPARTWPGGPAPVGPLDVVVVRMLAGDLYAGIEFPAGTEAVARLRQLVAETRGSVLPLDAGVSLKPISPADTRAVAGIALSFAREHGRRKVTVVHKATVMRATDGAFLAAAREASAKAQGDVLVDDRLVDTVCHDLVARPGSCDVLLTPMLYGDLLSDLCAGLTGGLGLAPGFNVGQACAVFEAVHGTAARHAGRNRANPMAVILSGAMICVTSAKERQRTGSRPPSPRSSQRDGRSLTTLAGGRDSEPSSTTAVAEAVVAAL
jgi:isocitrate dehydrogenase (NAD+)